MSYSILILVGNLGRDPEMKYTPSGQPVTNMSVAVNRSYVKDGEEIKETTWFRVGIWGKAAEACNQYLKKGSQVLVQGRLVPDKETGSPRVWEGQNGPAASFEVHADLVRFLSGGKAGEEHEAEAEETPF